MSKIVEASVALQEFLETRQSALLEKIVSQKELTDEISEELKSAVEDWRKTFD